MIHAYVKEFDGRNAWPMGDKLFRYYVTRETFQHPIISDALRDIEKVTEIDGFTFVCPTQRIKGVETLSHGVKTLVSMFCIPDELRSKFWFQLTTMGDNCIPYMQRIAEIKDINVRFSRVPRFDMSGYIQGDYPQLDNQPFHDYLTWFDGYAMLGGQ